MYKLFKYLLVPGFIFLIVQGCTEMLNKPQPSDELTQKIVLNDRGAVNAVRINMYARLHSFNYTTLYMLGPSAIADDFVNLVGTSRFEGLTQNQFGSGLGRWGTTYNLVNQANIILKGIPEGVINDQAFLDRIHGEAYFFRAFAMHNAVRAYGYEPNSSPSAGQGAGFNLGIIIQTEPTLALSEINFKPRSTVIEVYTLIKDDLQKAIGLLPVIGESGTNYVSQAAAQALLARVLLYEKSYSEADAMAQSAIDDSGARMAKPGEVATMFNEEAGTNPEAIFTLIVDPLTESQTTESVSGYTSTFWNAMLPSKSVLSTYSTGDSRNAWFAPCNSTNKDDCSGNYPADQSFTALELQKWNGEKTQQTDDIPFFRISELKLIQAEARAMAAGSVTQGAIDALNDVRVNRNLPALTTADFTSGGIDAFVDSVLIERRREFIGEGHRWYDLKRLQRDIPKPAVSPSAPLIPYTDIQILDNIPNEEVALSPDILKQNPGY